MVLALWSSLCDSGRSLEGSPSKFQQDCFPSAEVQRLKHFLRVQIVKLINPSSLPGLSPTVQQRAPIVAPTS
eukprot:6376072-Amphidinium_carterae.1